MRKILTLLVALSTPLLFYGQSPGGVGTPVVWLKAEQGVATSGSIVNGWANTGSSGGTASQLGRTSTTNWALPEYSANVHNFNPAVVDNSSTNDGSLLLADIFPTTAHRALSSFVLYSNSNVAQENNMISYTPLKLTSGALEAPFLGSAGANNLWFYWEGIYQTNPVFPNGIVRSNNIPSVNAFYVPQWVNTTTAHKASMSMNGATTIYPGTGLVNGASRPFGNQLFIFGDGNNNNGNAGGKVSEIITYDRDLTTTEKQQINSYLSVKYGISLTTDDGTAVPNYLNSSAGTVWNSTTNSGYNNNIAGIANDGGSALNQKQSKSVNTDLEQVIVSTTGLADTNSANTTALTNGQYLIWGDNGLARTFSQSITGLPQVTARFAAVWKVQNTGSVGQVRIAWPKNNGLHVIVSSDPTFASGNTATAMSNVQTINGIEYNYADVTVGNGQYFTFGKYLYAPGGVVPAAWYRADSPSGIYSDAGTTLAADNGQIQQWNEFNGMGTNISQATLANRPVYSNTTTLTNFNPTVTFDGSNDILLYQPSTNGNINILDRSKGALFSAGKITGIATMLGFGPATDDPGLYSFSGTNNLLLYPRTGEYDAISTGSTTGNYIGGGTWENGAGVAGNNAVLLSLKGNHQTFNTNIQNVLLDATRNDLRVGGDTDYARLDGQQNEVMVFPNKLTDDEVTKIESYLAIKYGQTLSNTQNRNYLSASGNVIWDGTNNSTYYNNIAGIGREDISALHQKQSRSVNDGQKLIIGAGNSLANTNALNTNTLTNGQFLIVGDNGLKQGPSVALANPAAPGGGTNYHFASVWKVKNTGGVGTVTIAWPSGLQSFHLVRSTDATIEATDTFIPMSGTTTVNGVTYNTATVTLDDGNYFTFAAYVHAPGGVLSSLWYRADKGLAPATGAVTTWTDYSAGQVPVTPTLSSSTSAPTSVNGTGLNLNFNPGVTFVPANALGNTGVLNALSGSNYTVYTSTTPVTGNGWDRIVGLSYSNLTGGNTYDSPGLGTENVIVRTNTGAAPLFTTVATGYRYNQFTNTTIVRNSFTNTLFTRAFNGAAPGGNVTYSNITTIPDGGIVLGRNANAGGDDGGAGMTMSETIVFDGALSANDVNRIDSYLAIKGGITLNTANTPDYLSSNSTNVWSSSTNTGYNNNIFGIANDFVSDLHQKQSKSINDGQKLIIGAGGALANTNALNTNTLTNGQFLIVGDNGLRQVPAVAITGITGVNYRFESIWKAQNTGNVGTVRVTWPVGFTNLRLIQSNDATFSTGNTATDMSANTQTVNGITYNYADVTIANGQYFTFAAFVQAPGGVVGPDFWVKSDDAGTIGTAWKDHSLNADDIPNVGAVSLSPADRSHNFYPYTSGYTGAKFFYNASSLMNPLGNVELPNTSHAIFSAVRPTTATGTGRITGIDDDTTLAAEPGVSIANGRPRHYEFFNTTTSTDFSTTFDNGISNVFSAIANNSVANGGTSTFAGGEKRIGLNGAYETTTFTGTNKFQLYGRNLRIGQAGWDASGPFPGDIMEVVWYKRTLNADEQSRVNSYLAVKNGVTLNENYLSTISSVVWDRTVNTGYNNNIFGIAKDDVTALHQKQAGSVNTGQQLVISTTGFADNNAANNTGLANDLQFLMAGDNGLKQGLSVPISGISGVNYRFASIWKAQNTGTVGTVRVAWPVGFTNLKLIQNSDATFSTGNTVTDMSVNTQTVNGVTYNYADVTLGNGQYFTFAAFAHAPGGVITGLSQWYRADIDAVNTGDGSDVTAWTDYFGGTVSTQKGTNALPKYKIGAADYFNFNPGLNFTVGTQTIGNNTVRTLTNLDYDVFTLTKEGMASGGSNPRYFSIAQDNSGASNNAIMDALGLSPTGTVERRPIGAGTQFPGINPAFSTTIPSIMYHKLTNTTAAKGLNGGILGTASTFAAQGEQFGGHYFGDTLFGANGSDNRGFTGNIGETIVYGAGTLSDAERRKVDTYLAIKYGVTLGRVATDNYISSADGTVWSGALNTAYNNNIFGLAKDDIESLHQKVSKSVNAGTILTMATNNDFVSQNIAASRTALSGDQKYFLAGDNSVTATALNSITVNTTVGQRIQRTWLSQRTNATGTVYFSADLSAYGTSFASGNNVRMIIADDAAFTTNVVSVAGTFTGGKWVHSHSFDSENTGRYITYAVLPLIAVDTDNDGVADSTDLDSDNDGILDANECSTNVGEIAAWNHNTADSWGATSVQSTYISSTSQSVVGSGITGRTKYISLAWLDGITATSYPDAVSKNAYIEYGFTTANFGTGTHYFYDKTGYWWPHDGTHDTNKYKVALAISDDNFASSTVLFTDAASMQDASYIFYNHNGKYKLNPGTSYKVRAYLYDLTNPGQTIDYDDYNVSITSYCDTDGDGIPDYLDLDSDNDGCVDAIEGDENVTPAMLVTASSGLSVGTGSSASNQNLCASGSCVDAQGVPTIVNSGGAADVGGDQGQGVGSSANSAVSACPTNCYKPAAVASVGNPALNSRTGITSLNRAGATGDNWPGIRTGGWLVLESKTKGFVPNRVAFSGGNPVGIAPANFVEGMLVYDTTNKCMKMYTSQDNGATFGWYCLNTQTCPD